jgi:hypothetical protein
MRTLVRHERGTQLVLMLVLAVVILFLSAYLYHLMTFDQVFATPDIYREQPVQVLWGKHGQ